MKKLFLIPLLLFSIFTMKSVSASTSFDIDYKLDLFYIPDYGFMATKNFLNSKADIISDVVSMYLDTYQSYKEEYPYYFINAFTSTDTYMQLDFYATDTLPSSAYNTSYNLPYNIYGSCSIDFTNNTSNCDGDLFLQDSSSTFYSYASSQGYVEIPIFFSNFDFYLTGLSSGNIGIETSGSDVSYGFLLPVNSPIPTLYQLFELDFLSDYDINQYEEVDLNDYAYIVLSLKDYNNLVSPVKFYVKGQLCLTSIYGYGQQERTNTDRCTLPYNSFTPQRVWITQEDLNNHVVYYVVPYDLDIDNVIKVNTRVFNISYITSEDADNPTALINGKIYPIKPYANLSSSATINENNNYIPGETTNVFDVSSNSSFITELFSNPLLTLGNVWTSIITMFALVGNFIALLPTTLQAFLYSAFSIGIVLGVIKILV